MLTMLTFCGNDRLRLWPITLEMNHPLLLDSHMVIQLNYSNSFFLVEGGIDSAL